MRSKAFKLEKKSLEKELSDTKDKFTASLDYTDHITAAFNAEIHQLKKDLLRLSEEKHDVEELFDGLKRDHSAFRRNVNSKLEEHELLQTTRSALEKKVKYLESTNDSLLEENERLLIRLKAVESKLADLLSWLTSVDEMMSKTSDETVKGLKSKIVDLQDEVRLFLFNPATTDQAERRIDWYRPKNAKRYGASGKNQDAERATDQLSFGSSDESARVSSISPWTAATQFVSDTE